MYASRESTNRHAVARPDGFREMLLVATGLLLLMVMVAPAAYANEALVSEIGKHAAAHNVTAGVAAIHVQSGESITVNGDQQFPLASTYKIPMAAYAFHLVEQGTLTLDQMIEVPLADYVPFSPTAENYPHPGVALSLLNLIEPMLVWSDNTATDMVLRTIGGGEEVTAWLRENAVENLRVDRSTSTLIRDYLQVQKPDDPNISLVMQADALAAEGLDLENPEATAAFYAKFEQDPRDHGSPLAMAMLLRKFWAGELIGAENTELMKAIMRRCKTGEHRLSGKLPPQALPIAHKTGTIGGTVNDAGVMTLPDGRGDVVIVVYTMADPSGGEAQSQASEAAIAEIARSVYDYFLLAGDWHAPGL